MDSKNLTRSEAAERADLISGLAYRLELDVSRAADPSTTTFGSRTTLTFRAASPGATTFLDFLHGGVDSVVLNGEELDTARVVGEHRIELPGLAAENTVVVTGRGLYSRSGEGLHRYVDPADGRTYLYTQYEPADARRVFANFEQPDLKAAYDVEITADASWHVASNGGTVRIDDQGDGSATWHFARTRRMSTYITALLAGPYHHVSDEWTGTLDDGSSLTIPLGATCRASLADAFDPEQIFDVTKRGLDLFHRLFAYPYPWGKYDQAFVPEYNLGAMENPGLVTFTEAYVFTSRATAAQYEGRANTLLHEMAHMWFGDLVTMEWWDDLWLKESFADFMGTFAVDRATDLGQPWVTFANRRKAWAYVQDQLPTTHPIVADIPDVEAAKQNFDGITYAKGASVLKQLAAYVGEDAFFAASRSYFERHAYGNTTLSDFLTVLEESSGRDMSGWADAWLKTAGVPVIGVDVTTDDDGVVTGARIVQEASDPVTGEPVVRPHVVRVGTFDLAGGRLARTGGFAVELAGAGADLPQLVGKPRPAVVLPNDEDLTYAKVRFDAASLETLLARLGDLDEPLAQATVWAALWNMVRDAALPATRFADAVARMSPRVGEVGVVQLLLEQAESALARFAPTTTRDAAFARLADTVLGLTHAAHPGSDHQLAFARALARLGRSAAVSRDVDTAVDGLLTGDLAFEGLEVDEQLRWSLVQARAARGRADQAGIDAALGAAPSAVATVGHALASAARPEPEVKAAAFRAVLTGRDKDSNMLSNDVLSATAAGFRLGSHELIDGFYPEYWDSLEDLWDRLSIGLATRTVQGLFPGAQDVAPAGVDAHAVLVTARDWLDRHHDAPAALRRIILEQTDTLERTLTAQAAAR
ncbi:aminopeptidase N [Zhihengliuella salsuginis]|uniref:Aminopeptidase N n=1 Tax=Zhihengliuella salsuginis TaxID=578222 RepID=A0ABQ3GCV4_9MICC|nr:aminopeptidase N [Zhihengliuella salsuginis]GHD01650.1 aminopeptidase [Zhihengliuella salsuginis]